MLSPARARLLELFKTRAFSVGQFTLTSGKQSTYYINSKLALFHSEAIWLLGVCPRIRRHSPFGGVSFAYLILFRPSMTSAGRSRSARA